MKEHMLEKFKKYYNKSREERIDILKDLGLCEESYKDLLNTKVMDNSLATRLVENQISILGLPLGLATNFVINGKEYVIPMAIEEPSVIAAASNAAKILGNITCTSYGRQTIGQIALYDVKKDESIIYENKDKLLAIANNTNLKLVELGAGAKDLKVEKKGEFTILYLYVDTLDAMGANTVDTMLEAIAPIVEAMLEAKKLMSILSNYATSALISARVKLEVEKEFGDRISLACKLANVDVYRAVTNNKGIFNGIDALALATGNDTRAIEAAGHAYATRTGKYRSLTNWHMEDNILVGELTMPMSIATFGGSIGLNPASKISLEILNNPNAIELAKIAVALGLAQNFAALRALVTEGIQKGHMKLQANSVAIFAGANDSEVDMVVDRMLKVKEINIQKAKEILGDIRNASNS